jgi:hypothetical protein
MSKHRRMTVGAGSTVRHWPRYAMARVGIRGRLVRWSLGGSAVVSLVLAPALVLNEANMSVHRKAPEIVAAVSPATASSPATPSEPASPALLPATTVSSRPAKPVSKPVAKKSTVTAVTRAAVPTEPARPPSTGANPPTASATGIHAAPTARAGSAALSAAHSADVFGVGVLLPTPGSLNRLRAQGINIVSLQLSWLTAEPVRGQLDQANLGWIRAMYASYRAAGFKVVLDAGLQTPPAWVFGLDPSTRFVNQYGDVWSGGQAYDVPDAVFDLNVRAAQANYLRALAAALADEQFVAIRVGGLVLGELHYPDAGYAGHQNSYWAFSAHALAASPVPNYRPGTGNQTDSTRFLDWYLASLNGYGTWLTEVYRQAFGPGPNLQILLPSWGIRPGEIAATERGRLTGHSYGELHTTINQGLDWANLLPQLAKIGGVVAYSTWLDAPDNGAGLLNVSPIKYLRALTKPLGMAIAGENTGFGSATAMALCLQRAKSLGLISMMWMYGALLADPHFASIADYGRLVRSIAP